MRKYLFTARDRERLRRWLETGEEDDTTRMLFVDIRQSLNRLTNDVALLTDVCRELRAQDRIAGRARLPRSLDSAIRRVRAKTRLKRI
jgi:hypothetical protein